MTWLGTMAWLLYRALERVGNMLVTRELYISQTCICYLWWIASKNYDKVIRTHQKMMQDTTWRFDSHQACFHCCHLDSRHGFPSLTVTEVERCLAKQKCSPPLSARADYSSTQDRGTTRQYWPPLNTWQAELYTIRTIWRLCRV